MTAHRTIVAHHEAGHAVACIKLDVEVLSATIKNCEGRTRWKLTREAPSRAERLILVTLAGPYAQARFAPDTKWFVGDDFTQVGKLLDSIPNSDELRPHLWDGAEKLVNQNWSDIGIVARLLLKRETLVGEDEIRAALSGGSSTSI